jgi:heme/copper-type cytochrome/quinol oxidase subunit 2
MAWRDLFSTDYGLMSLGVIVGVIVIGAYLALKFRKLMNERPEDQKEW